MPTRTTLFGLAALAALGLTIAALLRRRLLWGGFLFEAAVALGERWKEGRLRERFRALASSLTGSP